MSKAKTKTAEPKDLDPVLAAMEEQLATMQTRLNLISPEVRQLEEMIYRIEQGREAWYKAMKEAPAALTTKRLTQNQAYPTLAENAMPDPHKPGNSIFNRWLRTFGKEAKGLVFTDESARIEFIQACYEKNMTPAQAVAEARKQAEVGELAPPGAVAADGSPGKPAQRQPFGTWFSNFCKAGGCSDEEAAARTLYDRGLKPKEAAATMQVSNIPVPPQLMPQVQIDPTEPAKPVKNGTWRRWTAILKALPGGIDLSPKVPEFSSPTVREAFFLGRFMAKQEPIEALREWIEQAPAEADEVAEVVLGIAR